MKRLPAPPRCNDRFCARERVREPRASVARARAHGGAGVDDENDVGSRAAQRRDLRVGSAPPRSTVRWRAPAAATTTSASAPAGACAARARAPRSDSRPPSRGARTVSAGRARPPTPPLPRAAPGARGRQTEEPHRASLTSLASAPWSHRPASPTVLATSTSSQHALLAQQLEHQLLERCIGQRARVGPAARAAVRPRSRGNAASWASR